MEFEGVVHKIMPVIQGTSARGEWQKQDVVFELPGEFSRKVCVTFFNKPSDVARLREGAAYTVSVNIESREYNGRWYTDVRAWRLQEAGGAGAGSGVSSTASGGYSAPMPDGQAYGGSGSTGGASGSNASGFGSTGGSDGGAQAEVDDLPF